MPRSREQRPKSPVDAVQEVYRALERRPADVPRRCRVPEPFRPPDWYNAFDHDLEEAVRVRVRLLRDLAASRASLVAAHLSFPSLGRVAAAGDVFRFVPAEWEY